MARIIDSRTLRSGGSGHKGSTGHTPVARARQIAGQRVLSPVPGVAGPVGIRPGVVGRPAVARVLGTHKPKHKSGHAVKKKKARRRMKVA